VFRPDYGTSIPQSLFDSPEVVEEVIRQDISSVFSQFLPSLSLNSTSVNYDSNQNIMSVDVLYSLPGEDESEVISIGIASLSGNNPITEELL
jgi:hypothetical protein